MKTYLNFILSFLFVTFCFAASAQSKKEVFKVSGECGMCKKKIETAAKNAGATYALWNTETKELTVKYNATASNTAKIEKSIAGAGYDTPDFKATDAAYNKLDDCCKYDRTAAADTTTDACCAKADCMKDGKCDKNAACCKDKNCCTDGKCNNEAGKSTDGKTAASCCKKTNA